MNKFSRRGFLAAAASLLGVSRIAGSIRRKKTFVFHNTGKVHLFYRKGMKIHSDEAISKVQQESFEYGHYPEVLFTNGVDPLCDARTIRFSRNPINE